MRIIRCFDRPSKTSIHVSKLEITFLIERKKNPLEHLGEGKRGRKGPPPTSPRGEITPASDLSGFMKDNCSLTWHFGSPRIEDDRGKALGNGKLHFIGCKAIIASPSVG